MTLVAVEPGVGRPRLTLVGGALAPRLLSSDATGAKVALVATTALLLSGDHVEIELQVGPGAWLEIVETAGTVAYDADGGPSSWNVRTTVADCGLLLWHGEPFVVSRGANTERDSRFELGPEASVCLRETIVLGRSGEQAGAARIRTRANRNGIPLLVEDLDLTDATIRCLPGMLWTATVLDTVTLLGEPAPTAPMIEQGSRFELTDDAGTVARVLRTGLAGSPAAAWWATWSRSARDAYRQRQDRALFSAAAAAAQHPLPPSAAAERTPEPAGSEPR